MLAEADEVRERRDQVRHPAYVKPDALYASAAPAQVLSAPTITNGTGTVGRVSLPVPVPFGLHPVGPALLPKTSVLVHLG